MQKRSGPNAASGSATSTFDIRDFIDASCPVPAPFSHAGKTYITNGTVLIMVNGTHAREGYHESVARVEWDHDDLAVWSDAPVELERRRFDPEVMRRVATLPDVSFSDPFGGREPARFRFRHGLGFVWPVILEDGKK